MKLDIKTLPTSLSRALNRLGRYRVLLFCLLVASLYGYLVFQISQATTVQPSSELQTAVTKASPRIDPEVVQQLEQLQDNSVTVQALFNEARTNPFE